MDKENGSHRMLFLETECALICKTRQWKQFVIQGNIHIVPRHDQQPLALYTKAQNSNSTLWKVTQHKYPFASVLHDLLKPCLRL